MEIGPEAQLIVALGISCDERCALTDIELDRAKLPMRSVHDNVPDCLVVASLSGIFSHMLANKEVFGIGAGVSVFPAAPERRPLWIVGCHDLSEDDRSGVLVLKSPTFANP